MALRKRTSLGSLAKSRSRMTAPEVGRNLVGIFGPQTEKMRFPNYVRVLTAKLYALIAEKRSWCRI